MKEKDANGGLEEVRGKRGYLLPHHGLMATALPGMLEDYDRLYASLALTPRHLARREHESVWLAVLIAVQEALGTHHLARFREAGGTDTEAADLVALAAFLRGADAYAFVARHWTPHLPALDPESRYTAALLRAAGGLAPRLAHLCGVAAHACLGAWEMLRWQLRAAYRADVPEPELAEALSLAMFPGSVPYFARAAGIWRELIAAGEVDASPPFRAWAERTGQGGYDQASGVRSDDRLPES